MSTTLSKLEQELSTIQTAIAILQEDAEQVYLFQSHIGELLQRDQIAASGGKYWGFLRDPKVFDPLLKRVVALRDTAFNHIQMYHNSSEKIAIEDMNALTLTNKLITQFCEHQKGSAWDTKWVYTGDNALVSIGGFALGNIISPSIQRLTKKKEQLQQSISNEKDAIEHRKKMAEYAKIQYVKREAEKKRIEAEKKAEEKAEKEKRKDKAYAFRSDIKKAVTAYMTKDIVYLREFISTYSDSDYSNAKTSTRTLCANIIRKEFDVDIKI